MAVDVDRDLGQVDGRTPQRVKGNGRKDAIHSSMYGRQGKGDAFGSGLLQFSIVTTAGSFLERLTSRFEEIPSSLSFVSFLSNIYALN